MLKLIGLTAAAIFTAEALIMLLLESLGGDLSLPIRILLDASLLMICVCPTLYFFVFKEMTEQIRLRHQAEQVQRDCSQRLEFMVEERTERLQRANEELLAEVQERAKGTMALRTVLNEARSSKEQLLDIINAVRDALVVVDTQWHVQVVNHAAEVMFGASFYDLQGKSLKELLPPWSQDSADLERFFSLEQDDQSTFLFPPGRVDGEKHPVQMRFGAELKWEGHPATVLMFYDRKDSPVHDPKTI
jgi:PAS domain S-box-containing protein